MSFCDKCVSGVTHEGTPQGKIEEIGGVKCYVGTPSGDYHKDKVVLFLTDVFGLKLVNNQLLVDDFARNGFKTILPDYLNDDPIPEDAMTSGTFSMEWLRGVWAPKHGPAQTRPPLDKVIQALKESGVKSFAATGYCFGARYVFDLAVENIIQVSAVSHPSQLQVPADIEKYIAQAKAPLLINSCPVDQQFPPEAQSATDKLFGASDETVGKVVTSGFAPGYKRDHWDGCSHGFAVRGDMSDPKVKAGKEGSFKSTVEWFIKHL